MLYFINKNDNFKSGKLSLVLEGQILAINLIHIFAFILQKENPHVCFMDKQPDKSQQA